MDVPNNDYGDYLRALEDRDKHCCQWFGCPNIATQKHATGSIFCDRHVEANKQKWDASPLYGPFECVPIPKLEAKQEIAKSESYGIIKLQSRDKEKGDE